MSRTRGALTLGRMKRCAMVLAGLWLAALVLGCGATGRALQAAGSRPQASTQAEQERTIELDAGRDGFVHS